jgi:hypothetical protein
MRKAIAVLTILFVSSIALLAQRGNNGSLVTKEVPKLNDYYIPSITDYTNPDNNEQFVIPIVELPKKPNDALLEQMSDSTDNSGNRYLYVSTLFDYYHAAVAYETQLISLGETPKVKLFSPTIGQLSDTNIDNRSDYLSMYWQQASKLYKQLKKVPALETNKKMETLRKQIYYLDGQLVNLNEDIAKLKLDNVKLENYVNLYYEAINTINTLRKQINRHAIPTFGISAGASNLVLTDDGMSATFNSSVGLYLNPAQLLGTGSYVDLWFDYQNPTFKVTSVRQPYYSNNDVEHKASILSTGVNLCLPITRLLHIGRYNWSVKAGVGYYWLFDHAPNTYTTNTVWNGVQVKFETELDNFARTLPFGIYFSYSLMNTNNDLYIANGMYDNTNIEFGNRWIGSFNAGLRFFITSTK